MSNKIYVKEFLDAVASLKTFHSKCEIYSSKTQKRFINEFSEKEIRSLTCEIRKVLEVDELLIPFQADFANKALDALIYSRKVAKFCYYVFAFFVSFFLVPFLMQNFRLLFVDENSLESPNFINVFKMLVIPFFLATMPLVLLWKFFEEYTINTKSFYEYHTVERKFEEIRQRAMKNLVNFSINKRLLGLTEKSD